MATTIQLPSAIPGLHTPPTLQDLRDSSHLYNLLPEDHDQPKVSEEHLKDLYLLLERYNVQSRFGLHLIHGHGKIAAETVMYGKDLTSIRGCWTKPTNLEDLNLQEIHGHIFCLTPEGKFQAYEYREGFSAPLDVDPAFFQELAEYLLVNQITSLLGLQVLNKTISPLMCEFVMQNDGTVMLEADDVKRWVPYRTTGYMSDEAGIKELKGNEVHAGTTKDPHKVFYDGKLKDEEHLLKVLKYEEII